MIAIITQTGEVLAGGGAREIYWGIALFGTVLFALSGVLLLFGIGSSALPDDVDVDLDGDVDIPHPDTGLPDLHIISFRTILAFLTMFGWGGLVFSKYGGWYGLLGAFLCGLAMMFATAFLIALLMKLQQSGNVESADIVGKTGSVYMNIPGGMEKAGKVVVNLGTSTREVLAVAEGAIGRGTPVRIVKYLGGGRFTVEINQ